MMIHVVVVSGASTVSIYSMNVFFFLLELV